VSRLPVRIRLTLAFAAVMVLVLAATGVFVYLRFQSDLDESLNQSLHSRAGELIQLAGGDEPRNAGNEESFARVIGRSGRGLLTPAQLARARRGPIFVERTRVAGMEEPVRLFARPLASGRRVLVAGSALDDRDDALGNLLTVLLTGGLAALALASLSGYGLASAALRPVESMRRRAADISRLDRGGRLPVPGARDELAQLGETLNEMLERLEQSLERERGFVANASHELRTPLSLLKGELELALREGRSPEQLRAAIVSAVEESDRLAQLAEDLLVLARSDQGQLPVRPEPIAAEEVLSSVARRFGRRTDEGGRELRVEPSAGLWLEADRLRVEQALANLVDNALRYGAGAVTLTADRSAAGVVLHVRDEGPGFTPELLGSAFERFTRGDRGRGRGGTGLGLAIVETVARAHGRRAGARNREAGGADVWIELPGALIASSSEADRPPSQQPIEGGTR
jgi:two-component system, OmpR family, sensor kinase